MLILKILGWILFLLLGLLLLILALLFTALLAPVKLRLSYNREDGFYAGLRYLWIKKQLAPPPKEKPKPPKRHKRGKAEFETHGEREAAYPSGPAEEAIGGSGGPGQADEGSEACAERIPPPPALRETKEKLKKAPDAPAGETDAPLQPDPPQPESFAGGAEPEEGEKKAADGGLPGQPEYGKDRVTGREQEEKEDRIFAFSIDKLGTLAGTAGGFIKRVLQSLRYEDICLTLPVKGRDAADCALKFGRVNAALSGFFTACSLSRLRYTFKEVRVFPDFSAEDTGGVRFAMTLRGQGLWVLTATLWTVRLLMREKILFPGGIPFFKKHDDKKDGGKKI